MTVCTRVQTFLQRINERRDLNAFLATNDRGAMLDASASDERIAAGLARPLEGRVVALKDNISFKALPMTCASRMLEGFHPVYDATVVERLRNAGAVVIGKTNMDEFAMGSSSETSYFGPVKHPIDTTRVPGGSSGGSAVAVADGMCDVALGSDTGGSIRQPAAFCGVYGFKPTYGRVSRYGLVAFASSLDQIGVFANNVADVVDTFHVISGHDPMDSTTVQSPAESPLGSPSGYKPLRTDPSRKGTDRIIGRVGVLNRSVLNGCDASIVTAYDAFVDRIRSTGAIITDVSITNSEIWIPTYFVLATAEASSNLARFDGVRYGHRSRKLVSSAADASADDADVVDFMTASRTEGFGTEVKRRIMLGTYVLSSGYYDAYYRKAQQARRLISNAYTEIFKSVDALAMPTTPTTAFVRGEKSDPVQMWLSDFFTVSANIAGIPAISIPSGTDASGLPIGMQLQGAMMEDERLLAATDAIPAP